MIVTITDDAGMNRKEIRRSGPIPGCFVALLRKFLCVADYFDGRQASGEPAWAILGASKGHVEVEVIERKSLGG